jgi:hypothetical protein
LSGGATESADNLILSRDRNESDGNLRLPDGDGVGPVLPLLVHVSFCVRVNGPLDDGVNESCFFFVLSQVCAPRIDFQTDSANDNLLHLFPVRLLLTSVQAHSLSLLLVPFLPSLGNDANGANGADKQPNRSPGDVGDASGPAAFGTFYSPEMFVYFTLAFVFLHDISGTKWDESS